MQLKKVLNFGQNPFSGPNAPQNTSHDINASTLKTRPFAIIVKVEAKPIYFTAYPNGTISMLC